jgi:hypothetical protein
MPALTGTQFELSLNEAILQQKKRTRHHGTLWAVTIQTGSISTVPKPFIFDNNVTLLI